MENVIQNSEVESLFQDGLMFLVRCQVYDAIERLEKITKDYPDFKLLPWVHWNLAIAYWEMPQHHSEVIHHLRLALSLIPDADLQPENALLAYQRLGKCHFVLGEHEASIEYFKKAHDLFPDNLVIHWWLARVLWSAGKERESGEYFAKFSKLQTLKPKQATLPKQ